MTNEHKAFPPQVGHPQPIRAASVAVCDGGLDQDTHARAKRLADRLALPLVEASDRTYEMLLAVTDARLELRFTDGGACGPVYVDFVSGRLGYSRRVNRFGRLFQAVGLDRGTSSVIDATAGLGKDAFLLAYHGCKVTAIERCPVLHALLEDGIGRASKTPQTREALADRLRLIHADAREHLARILTDESTPSAEDPPDVIYLDPMFPARRKNVLVKKELRAVRQLVGDDPDAADLVDIARAVAREHVVVKRTRLAPPLAPDPIRTYVDRTTRYDIYAGRG